MQWIIKWFVNALSLFIVAQIIPGIVVSGFVTALVASFFFGVVNILIKPILFVLTLPITILTLGLFSFILNALMFLLVSGIVDGFEVSSFLAALLGSILLSIVSTILNKLVE